MHLCCKKRKNGPIECMGMKERLPLAWLLTSHFFTLGIYATPTEVVLSFPCIQLNLSKITWEHIIIRSIIIIIINNNKRQNCNKF